MDESKPTIIYSYANLCLKPETLFSESNWKEEIREGKLSPTGCLDLLVEDNYFMQMHGISIPVSSMGAITRPQEVVQAVRNLLGDCKNCLAKYNSLVDKSIIQDTIYFTPEGLYDYSHELQNPKGKNVGSWIDYASSVSSDLKSYFPRGFSVPNGKLEFVPTFEKMRSMRSFVRKGSNNGYLFSGDTFQERIERFLEAYAAFKAHEKWSNEEERRINRDAKDGTFTLYQHSNFCKVVVEQTSI